MATPLNTIKNWFKTGLKPTQTQFWAMFDSFWHKAEEIPTSSINGLDGTLDNKVDMASYDIEQQEVADALVTIGEDVTGKVDKVDGKGLSTNDFTDEAEQTVTDAEAHLNDNDIHVTADQKKTYANKLKTYVAGEVIQDVIGDVFRISDNKIYSLNAPLPYTTNDIVAETVDGNWTIELEAPEAGLTVKDADGIDQFTGSFALFEGFGFDAANKKIITPKQVVNTIVRGLPDNIIDKFSFAQTIVKPQQPSTPFSVSEVENLIPYFEKNGDELRMNIVGEYFLEDRFGQPSALAAKSCTHYYDFYGWCTGFIFQPFRNTSGAIKLVFNGIKSTSSLDFSGIDTLEQLEMPLLEEVNMTSLPSLILTKKSFPNAKIIRGLGQVALPSIFDNELFPKLEEIDRANFFKDQGVVSVNLLTLKKLGVQATRFPGNQMTSFITPNLEVIDRANFEEANFINPLSFPNLIEVVNGDRTFTSNGFDFLDISKCKNLGNSSGFTNMFLKLKVGCVIYANEFLKTNNNGLPDGDLQYAKDVRSAKIVWISDRPVSFFNEELNVTETYIDDAAAASGGIEVGMQYIRDTGITAVRLT